MSTVALILFLMLENGEGDCGGEGGGTGGGGKDSGQILLDKQYSLAQLWCWI